MVSRLAVGAACTLLAAVAAAGCAAESSEGPASAPAPTTADATVSGLTLGGTPFAAYRSAMEAGWSGHLEIRSGCVVLVSGTQVFVPVFPADTVLEADSPGSGTLRVGTDIMLPLGAPVSGGGGYTNSFEGMIAPECEQLELDEYVLIHTFNR